MNFSLSNSDLENHRIETSSIKEDDSSFLEILSRIQSNRLDDQRCTIKKKNQENKQPQTEFKNPKNPDDDFFNLIIKSQQSRLEDQRSTFSKAPRTLKSSSSTTDSTPVQNQLTSSSSFNSTNEMNIKNYLNKGKQACTIPADDAFFSMIQKIQSRRLDEQRTNIKSSIFSSFHRKK